MRLNLHLCCLWTQLSTDNVSALFWPVLAHRDRSHLGCTEMAAEAKFDVAGTGSRRGEGNVLHRIYFGDRQYERRVKEWPKKWKELDAKV